MPTEITNCGCSIESQREAFEYKGKNITNSRESNIAETPQSHLGQAKAEHSERRIAELESKLEDTVELLHMWKSEACAYRHFLKAVVERRFSLEQVEKLLESAAASGQ